MKKNLLSLAVILSAGVYAQTASPVKTFKSKEAKVRANNLQHVSLHNGNIELLAFVKKGSAEKLVFNSDLQLQSRIDTVFDFEADEKKRREIFKQSSGVGASFEHVSVDVLKSDVIEIASADALSKAAGLNLLNKTKVGMIANPGFAIQKGDIQFVTNVMGDRVRTFTTFVAKEEIRLKSDEGKNLMYEFHSSGADGLRFEFKESDTYNKSKMESMKSFMNQDADLLLVAKRKPIVKFGKAPTANDLLPVYYIYKVSPKTMDIVTESKFSEPVARAVVFRESLKRNKSILLVSAPTDITGDKSPSDPDPRNYIFRIIGEDTKIKQEFNYQVPSGQTQFAQALELPDGSIALTGITNIEKKDKYVNKGTLPMAYDACFTMVIKDGKVVSTDIVNTKDFQNTFATAQGEKLNAKNVWMPTHELTRNFSNIELADGGVVSAWTVTSQYGGGYTGDVVLHFSPQGKLVGKYWVASKNNFTPALESELFRKNDKELYLVTHVNNDKGALDESHVVKIDLGTKSMGPRTLLGDEKHVLTEKFPYVQVSDKELQVFGFDKGGKEFWTQRITF